MLGFTLMVLPCCKLFQCRKKKNKIRPDNIDNIECNLYITKNQKIPLDNQKDIENNKLQCAMERTRKEMAIKSSPNMNNIQDNKLKNEKKATSLQSINEEIEKYQLINQKETIKIIDSHFNNLINYKYKENNIFRNLFDNFKFIEQIELSEEDINIILDNLLKDLKDDYNHIKLYSKFCNFKLNTTNKIDAELNFYKENLIDIYENLSTSYSFKLKKYNLNIYSFYFKCDDNLNISLKYNKFPISAKKIKKNLINHLKNNDIKNLYNYFYEKTENEIFQLFDFNKMNNFIEVYYFSIIYKINITYKCKNYNYLNYKNKENGDYIYIIQVFENKECSCSTILANKTEKSNFLKNENDTPKEKKEFSIKLMKVQNLKEMRSSSTHSV